MTRVIQPRGTRGSLKWIQIAINEFPSVLNKAIDVQGKIEWLSPLSGDDFAEYRDGDFLRLIGCENLISELASFWPKRGPQWDALGRTDRGEILIVEAKAHISELFSPPSAARPESRAKIDAALQKTATFLNSKSPSSWGVHFYQLTNRLAHLMFLREHKVNARLVFLSFIGDDEMKGPKSREQWEAAYAEAAKVLGLQNSHELSEHITHAYVDVRSLA
jgi:hypothetical protein